MNKFLDFDIDKKDIYYNIYLNEEHLIIKIPLISKVKNKNEKEDIKIERFDLENYKYEFLLNCQQVK